jgi:type II secretory pathway pseudopilin PulG
MPIGSRDQTGFTYVGLLIAVVFFGMGSVGAARLLASTERAEREAELLFVGHQFRQAIRSYLQAGPKIGQYPATLEDLLLDRRYPTIRRHLRRVFVDPITGKADWVLISAPEGGIMGVSSRSEREPLKRANFEPEDSNFAMALQLPQVAGSPLTTNRSPLVAASSSVQLTPLGAMPYSYHDWKFVYRTGATGGATRPAESGG